MRPALLKTLLASLLLWLAAAGLPGAQKADSTAADTAKAAVRPDSGLGRHDSTLILEEKYSSENYLARREQFNYPRTGRSDPFDFPMGKATQGELLGPTLSELELTGVLYAPDGPRIAILSTSTGDNLLLHEGDRLGVARLSLIEPTYINFVISEFGQVREYVIELKPLVEGTDGSSSSKAGNGGRLEETGQQSNEGGGPPPKER